MDLYIYLCFSVSPRQQQTRSTWLLSRPNSHCLPCITRRTTQPTHPSSRYTLDSPTWHHHRPTWKRVSFISTSTAVCPNKKHCARLLFVFWRLINSFFSSRQPVRTHLPMSRPADVSLPVLRAPSSSSSSSSRTASLQPCVRPESFNTPPHLIPDVCTLLTHLFWSSPHLCSPSA